MDLKGPYQVRHLFSALPVESRSGFYAHDAAFRPAPDSPVATIVLECDSEPTQNTDYVRENKPRAGV